MRVLDFDVIVVGASIAGATSAVLLARQGHKVLVIDKKRSNSDYKKICTTFIQRSALPVIKKIGLREKLDEVGAIRNDAVFWTKYGWIVNKKEYESVYAHGYSIRREVLDPLLIELIRNEPNVTLQLEATLFNLLEDENKNFNGIAYKTTKGKNYNSYAQLVVLADGRSSRGAEIAQVPTKKRNNKRFVYYSFYRNLPLKSDKTSQFWQVGKNMGFAYPFDNSLTMLCCFVVDSQYKDWKENKHEALETFFGNLYEAPDLSQSERISKVYGMRKINDYRRPATFRGLALVGDACVAFDPMSGTGCGFAFQSADWLAETVGPALSHKANLTAALKKYKRIHHKNLSGHEYFIQDNSTGRDMNIMERFISRAAVVDSEVAHRLHLFVSRVTTWHKFLTIGTITRVLKANLTYVLEPHKERFHEIS